MKKDKTAATVRAQGSESSDKLFTFYYVPRNERYEIGKQLRKNCPRSSHKVWEPPVNRKAAVSHVLEGDKERIPNLIPLRHGRMARSPFTFYRGAALNMAADLAGTPATNAIMP